MPKNTAVCYTDTEGLRHKLQILQDGRVISNLDIASFVGIDSSLIEIAAKAMAYPGTKIPVPTHSNARGLKPRNYGACGIAQ